jgi:DNA-directed RNA polymerase subunit beta
LVEDFVDEDTGEVVSIERNEIILDRETILEKEHIDEIVDAGVKSILIHKENSGEFLSFIIHYKKTLPTQKKKRLEYIYRQLRNAEPPDEETARGIIEKLFFSEQRYSLGEVGRYRLKKN